MGLVKNESSAPFYSKIPVVKLKYGIKEYSQQLKEQLKHSLRDCA